MFLRDLCALQNFAVQTVSFQQTLAARIFPYSIAVEPKAEAWRARNRQHAVVLEVPATFGNFVDEGRAGQILNEIGAGKGGGQLQICSEPNRRVPTVRDEAHT